MNCVQTFEDYRLQALNGIHLRNKNLKELRSVRPLANPRQDTTSRVKNQSAETGGGTAQMHIMCCSRESQNINKTSTNYENNSIHPHSAER